MTADLVVDGVSRTFFWLGVVLCVEGASVLIQEASMSTRDVLCLRQRLLAIECGRCDLLGTAAAAASERLNSGFR